jgi:hypothetical protein
MAKRNCVVVLGMAIVSLSGCSFLSGPKKVEKPPPEPVTGLHALAQMYSAAKNWSPDLQILREVSLQMGDIPVQPGKSPVWQATFVSPTLGQSRVYTYAISDLSPSVREGIFPEPPAPFSNKGQQAQPFVIQAVKKDTDELYETAMTHGKAFRDAHPDMKINYLLEFNNRSPNAAWRVMWGDTPSSAAFSVLLDATNGVFIEVLN